MKFGAVVLLTMFPFATHCQVYKCNVDGKVVYQGEACAGGKKLEIAAAAPTLQATNAPVQPKKSLTRLDGIEVGMSAARVQSAWGPPSRVFRSVTSDHTEVQWIYDGRIRPGDAHYVILRDGVVSSISLQVPVKP